MDRHTNGAVPNLTWTLNAMRGSGHRHERRTLAPVEVDLFASLVEGTGRYLPHPVGERPNEGGQVDLQTAPGEAHHEEDHLGEGHLAVTGKVLVRPSECLFQNRAGQSRLQQKKDTSVGFSAHRLGVADQEQPQR